MSAEVRQIRTAAEQGLTDAFAAARGRLPGGDGIAALRTAAFGRFEAKGLPHRRIEEWKYTDLRALMREAKPLSASPGAAEKARAKGAGAMLASVEARRLAFVDGTFVPELSDLADLEPGLTVRSLADALAEGDTLVAARLGTEAPADVALALNTAFMGDGAVIRLAPGASLKRPLHLAFAYVGAPAAFFQRSLVEVGNGARLALIETHDSVDDGRDEQVNTALNIAAGDEAHVDYVKIGLQSSRALHLATLIAEIGAGARFNTFLFTTGGAVTRNQSFVRCGGKGATLRLGGASLLKDRQHADTTLMLDHAAPGCQSREVFKAVLDGASRGIFQGKIVVRSAAQKTDARMMTQALLLSEDAEADNKPELEIFADDVQCGHGATAGALDENLKFYLMARGISEKEAEALLVQAFIGEAVEGIEHAGLRDELMTAAERWLKERA